MNTRDTLRLNPAEAVESITEALLRQVGRLRRSGIVVAMSGGVDNAVGAATGPVARRAGVLHSPFPRVRARASSSSLPG